MNIHRSLKSFLGTFNLNIYILSNRQLSGGPATFINHMLSYFNKSDYNLTFKLDFFNLLFKEDDFTFFYVNLITDFKKLFLAIFFRRKGVVARLGAPYFLAHDCTIPLKSRLRYRLINYFIFLQANFLATHVVFQSEYVRDLWPNIKTKHSIIYNPTALSTSFWSPSFNLNFIAFEFGWNVSAEGQFAFDYIEGLRIPSLTIYGSHSFGVFKDQVKYRLPVGKNDVGSLLTSSGNVLVILDQNPACPNIVLEAMSCGTPIVCSRVGSLVELLGNDYPLFDFNFSSISTDDLYDLLSFVSSYLLERSSLFTLDSTYSSYEHVFNRND